MAAAIGLSNSTVQRIWARHRIKPHRLERYTGPQRSRSRKKAAAIIALYMDPPQHAAVFCVALDRLDAVLPIMPGTVERHGLSIIGMEPYHYRRRWPSKRERCMANGRAPYQRRIHRLSQGVVEQTPTLRRSHPGGQSLRAQNTDAQAVP